MEDMRLANQQYDKELAAFQKSLTEAMARKRAACEMEQWREELGRQVADLVDGRSDREMLYQKTLNRMVVQKSRSIPQFFTAKMDVSFGKISQIIEYALIMVPRQKRRLLLK